MFNTKYISEEEAKNLLDKDEITGYLKIEDDKPKVIVTTSGINETILKYVTEEISQTNEIMKNVAEKRIESYIETTPPEEIGDFSSLYETIYKEVLEMQNEEANIKDISSSNLSYTMIEFYTLIAMTCLYGGILGMVAINQNLANMSSKGKRVSVAPTSKGKVIFSSLLAGYLTQLIGLAILFIYTVFVLKVDYGTNLPLIILLGIVGSLAGLSMGLAIATVIKANENLKTGIVISITMLRMFLIRNDGNHNEIYN